MPRALLLAFTLPGLLQGMMHSPAESLSQGVYAKHAGLSLTALGLAVMFTRLFDALTYPLIGFLSDYTTRRAHTRKPWLVAGTTVSVIGLWFLYRPPAQVGIAYFTTWFMVNYLGWKMMEIPYLAWSLELSTDYVQRARIAMWRGIAILIGPILFFIVPYIAKPLGLLASTEIDFDLLGLESVIVLCLAPVMAAITLWRVPSAEPGLADSVTKHRESLGAIWRSVARNRPLLRLLASMVPVTFLVWMAVGAIYLFADTYLGLGKQFAAISLLAYPANALAGPILGSLCLRFERHRVLAMSYFAGAALFVLQTFIPRGDAGALWLGILWPLILFFVAGSIYVVLPQLLGDCADFGRLELNEERTGLYSAALLFTQKSLGGVAAGFALTLVGWFGFNATGGEQTVAGTFGIKLAAGYLPAIGLALGGLIVWGFPIDRKRQHEIRAALLLREAQAS